MKAYTDLEQSKKLAEILSLESADMTFCGKDNALMTPYLESKESLLACCAKEENLHPCWSLAALLDITRKYADYSLQSFYNHIVMSCSLGDKPDTITLEDYDNFVDACVDMLIKFRELKML